MKRASFRLFPQLPTELRLKIWNHAAAALTGGARVVELFWIDPDSLFSKQFRRPEDGRRLMLVNQESREQYTRSHKLVPRLRYPWQKGDAERLQYYFTHPQYINPQIDSLFVADTLPVRNAVLLDRISEAHILDELRFLAFRVQSGSLVYNILSLARFPRLQAVTASINDAQFQERIRGGKVSFVKPVTSHNPQIEQEIIGMLQAMLRTRSEVSQSKLLPFDVREVSRKAVCDMI